MQYPLQRVPERGRLPAFLALLLLTLGVGSAMPSPPETLVAPWGIVNLELAGDVQKARAILSSWGVEGWRRAVTGVRLDFLFLLCYSTVIAAACVWVPSPFRGRRGSELAAIVAWGQWTAAFLDALENIALLKVLLGETVRQPWPRIVFGCAVSKFVLIGIGLTYATVGAAVWLMKR